MKIRNKRTITLRLTSQALTLTVLLLAVVGCSGPKVTTKLSAELPRYQIRTIALIPFTTLATPQVRDVVNQTISAPPGIRPADIVHMPLDRSDMSMAMSPTPEQVSRQTVTVPSAAGDTVTQLLWNRLRDRQGVIVLSPAETTKALASSATSHPPPIGQSPAVTVAKHLKADAALIGQVSVYQERVGGRFGASPPATVGFDAKVVAVDGQVLWEGNYYEKQRPMIEDMMGFFQRRGMFVTAEELVIYGVEQMLLEFPFGTAGGR